MTKACDAYWLSPTFEIFEVKQKHINFISENVEKFGLTRVDYNLTFKKYNEPFGFEGKARNELMENAFKKGWIRLRNRVNQGYVCELWEYNKSAKANVLNWVQNILMKSDAYVSNSMFELEIHEVSKFIVNGKDSNWKFNIKFFI